MTGPRYTPIVDSLPATVPFVGPEAQERARGAGFTARLGANESVFGPSPRAIAAMKSAAAEAWMYGDPENHDLKHALAAELGVSPDCVVVGEGIDGLLGYAVRLFVGKGDPVVTSDGAYPTFNYHVTGFGGVLHKVPYRDDREDPEALAARAREVNARMVYFANPDNPMGTWHDAETVEALISAIPETCVLILDEAYVEFAPESAAPAIDTSRANVVHMRTFSKAHGLAGARVGYAVGHAGLIRSFEKIRNHFGMSRISQAGALAALGDRDWQADVRARVALARERLGDIARANAMAPLPSATNFVTMDTGRDGQFARALVAALGELGVFVRMPFVAPGDRCIRVSCGTEKDLNTFSEALPRALQRAAGTRKQGT